jgi:hypothetical protein
MGVPVMQVRIMHMLVHQPLMPVRVGMGLWPGIALMLVLMMFVMDMEMVVLHRFMHMEMLVALGQMQP